MKIAVFDIDGTMTDEIGFAKKYAPVFLKKKGFEAVEVTNAYDVADIYDLNTQLIRKGYSEQDAGEEAERISQEFWNRYFVRYCKQPLREGVKGTIDSLRRCGYNIYIVSMRGKKAKKERLFDLFVRTVVIPFLTKRQLIRANIKFDYLEMPLTVDKKIEYVTAINPSFFLKIRAKLLRRWQ